MHSAFGVMSPCASTVAIAGLADVYLAVRVRSGPGLSAFTRSCWFASGLSRTTAAGRTTTAAGAGAPSARHARADQKEVLDQLMRESLVAASRRLLASCVPRLE